MYNERLEKSNNILREMQKGEEGVDKVRLPEDYIAAVNNERLKGITWLKNAINSLNKNNSDKKKADDIKTWRKTNKLLEPIDLKFNTHMLDQYRKNSDNESILQNPKGFTEWFIKTQPRETVQQLSKIARAFKNRKNKRNSQ